MSSDLRFSVIKQAIARKPVEPKTSNRTVSDYFGELVFNTRKMKKYLSKDTYSSFEEALNKRRKMDENIADQVAAGMQAWAMENGATHFTHWFQPLTDATAEKHDAFIDLDGSDSVIENFSGKTLIQQEPDASSFPSGGIRDTFEARGYTAWDISSPAFLIGTTLCIPTIFVSYTGDSLDHKTPLLKALDAVNKSATRIAQYFDRNISKVTANLGWEQEFFLIDEAIFHARPDLVLTGRTLVGKLSSKNQQLSDHYFGSIPERVQAFMEELEYEAHRLGIPLKTRHNEVAPNQFEVAPIFEEAHIAADHNQLLMDIMSRVASKHFFKVLLHEKPFAGINGSGKHCNWSLTTNTGVNLFSPTKKPKGNLQFFTFIVNTLKAIMDNQDLLLASIMSAGNAHRLGANEAPPAIISAYLGKWVSKVLDELEKKTSDTKLSPSEKISLKLGVIGKLPEIRLDNTDRNRTSPFAFTGNRFELRATGSSVNTGEVMTVLNTIIARQLDLFHREVENTVKKDGVKAEDAIIVLMRRLIRETKKIHFDEDGYSEEWKTEAANRGLTNVRSVTESIEAYSTLQTKDLFEKTNVLSEAELRSRANVKYEMYAKKIQIEARVLGGMVLNHIIPTCIQYETLLLENAYKLKSIFSADEYQEMAGERIGLIKELNNHISQVKKLVGDMVNERKKANKLKGEKQKAIAYDKNVRPYLDEIRYHVDKLELIVDNKYWSLPKYREMLFIR